MTTIDLFPLGAPDAAFERLGALLTTLRDAIATLRTCETPASGDGASSTSGSNSKPQISLVDLAKKAAESDAKAHKWQVEELRTTIVGLRDELSESPIYPLSFSLRERSIMLILHQGKVKAERKSAPASRMQDVPVAQDKLASHLPPSDELDAGPALEAPHDNKVINSEPEVRLFFFSRCA